MQNGKRKVCVVTGTRAEYGLFYPIMKKIQDSKQLELLSLCFERLGSAGR